MVQRVTTPLSLSCATEQPYSDLPQKSFIMDIDEIQNYIHGISQLQLHFEHGRNTVQYTEASEPIQEYVRLLDGVSLVKLRISVTL